MQGSNRSSAATSSQTSSAEPSTLFLPIVSRQTVQPVRCASSNARRMFFHILMRVAHGPLACQLSLSAAVHHHARGAQRHGKLRGLHHITDIFLHPLGFFGREVDENGA